MAKTQNKMLNPKNDGKQRKSMRSIDQLWHFRDSISYSCVGQSSKKGKNISGKNTAEVIDGKYKNRRKQTKAIGNGCNFLPLAKYNLDFRKKG